MMHSELSRVRPVYAGRIIAMDGISVKQTKV